MKQKHSKHCYITKRLRFIRIFANFVNNSQKSIEMNIPKSTLQTLGRYPVGQSDFVNIRQKGSVYVDKTDLIYQMTHDTDYYFLSRPRRFGKSLMLSTLEAYFQGKKELFEGLAIYNLEDDWTHHPVIHLSMGGMDFSDINVLRSHLNKIVNASGRELGVNCEDEYPENSFFYLIRNAYQKYGERVVVLIDEYDKPMLDTRHRDDILHEDIKNLLRGFYGVIKDSAAYIRFAMITGVTKFSHVNIFSGLNNLRDISLDPRYNALCGISESEMAEYFSEDIKLFAERNGMTPEEASREFKIHYDGYRFAAEGENIYNPFSTIQAFANMEFDNYWFASGTSDHLIRELQHRHYNFDKIEGTRLSKISLMSEPSIERTPNALLYQAGYLTIKDFKHGMYTLGFPNKEVSSSFYNVLLKYLVPVQEEQFSAMLLSAYAQEGDVESMMEMLHIGLSHFNHMEMKKPEYEYHFKVILKALLMAASLSVEGEVSTPAGRIDMVLKTKQTIYLFEFKLDSTPEIALQQIDDKDYPFRYYGDARQVVKIGANFSTDLRRLTGWVVCREA